VFFPLLENSLHYVDAGKVISKQIDLYALLVLTNALLVIQCLKNVLAALILITEKTLIPCVPVKMDFMMKENLYVAYAATSV
jgi:hypothetical protein